MTFEEALGDALKRARAGTLAHGDLELLLAQLEQLQARNAELQAMVEKIKE
jgi:hypothetical protein